MTTGYAMVRGGGPERLGAVVLLWLTVGVLIIGPLLSMHLRIDWAGVIVDLIGLASFLYLGLRTDRTWTLWACSAQVIAVIGHLVSYIQAHEADLAYGVMTRGPAYIQCLALLIGTRAYSNRAAKRASSTFWPT
jgi:exosortase/archaeosortase